MNNERKGWDTPLKIVKIYVSPFYFKCSVPVIKARFSIFEAFKGFQSSRKIFCLISEAIKWAETSKIIIIAAMKEVKKQ